MHAHLVESVEAGDENCDSTRSLRTRYIYSIGKNHGLNAHLEYQEVDN